MLENQPFFDQECFENVNFPLSKNFNLFKSVLTQESDSISVFVLIFIEILTKIPKFKISKSEGIFFKAEMAIRDHLRSPGLEDSQKLSLTRLKIGIELVLTAVYRSRRSKVLQNFLSISSMNQFL